MGKWTRSQIIMYEVFPIVCFLIFAWGIIEYVIVGDNRKWAEIRLMGGIGGAALCLGFAVYGLVSYLRHKKETKEDT